MLAYYRCWTVSDNGSCACSDGPVYWLIWVMQLSWWRHQMETFSGLLALCAGNSPVTGEFPSQRPVKRSCDVFFDLRMNKRLSKQSIRRWFETPSHSLWHHCNDSDITHEVLRDFAKYRRIFKWRYPVRKSDTESLITIETWKKV